VLRGEDDSPLVALRKRCHEKIHAGKDLSWQETERRLAEIVVLKDAEIAKRGAFKRAKTVKVDRAGDAPRTSTGVAASDKRSIGGSKN
jgi:hypothetical protein